MTFRSSRLLRRTLPVFVVVSSAWLASITGCGTTRGVPPIESPQLEAARDALFKPLPGDIAALYRLRVRASGGLRLALLTHAGAGRVTISEPFGSAVSLTAWQGTGTPEVFDLRERCRFSTNDLSGVLGVGNLPLPQAARLMGGRLPAADGDRVDILSDGRLRVTGSTWSGLVSVAPEPWRIVAVEDTTGGPGSGWTVRIRDHTLSVPGWIRVKGADGRWAELELVRLQWNTVDELPPVPEIAPCGGTGGRTAIPEPDRPTGS
jgi:hypothetical protein